MLCPLLGKVLARSELDNSFPDSVSTSSFLSSQDGLQIDKPLCLQDPFELSHNVCKNLPEKAVRRLVLFSREAAKLAQQCLSPDLRPPSGLCSLLELEVCHLLITLAGLMRSLQVPELEEERVNYIDNWPLQLQEEKAALFQQNLKLHISNQYLQWFKKQRGLDNGKNDLIACVDDLLGILLLIEPSNSKHHVTQMFVSETV